MSFQDPTEDIETEQYLAYPDLSKELELKYQERNQHKKRNHRYQLYGKHHRDATEQFEQTLQNRITRKDCSSYLLTPNQNTPINPNQALLFKASPEICSLANVANLYLLAKAHKHFKIPIHNSTEDVIEISEGTLIGSISADSQNPEKPQSIPDFAQLFLFCNITLQV
ncbi:hypothetical protein G9A89_021871 [Geosiphon pyriformis]|nr:hypothetical protein G9A89_021871 [Geosiphon pyriformis]